MNRPATQTSLFDLPPAPPRFDGETIEPQDVPRLAGQMKAVFELMSDEKWRTLAAIWLELRYGRDVNASEASISARLRDLRKARWGSHTVNRRRRTDSLHEYQLIRNI